MKYWSLAHIEYYCINCWEVGKFSVKFKFDGENPPVQELAQTYHENSKKEYCPKPNVRVYRVVHTA